jgi:hypothetical protein
LVFKKSQGEKMLKKGLISLATAAMLASSALAVTISQDGTGDYLVAPMFTYGNGYKTNLKLMNTDNSHAYLVRGVVRSKADSHELMDFTVMMSPGDVWEATIENGKIVSNDDSNWEGSLDAIVNEDTGYVEFFILAELDNNNEAVKNALVCSNYTQDYKSTTVDVCSIEKSTLKTLFVQALGGENIATVTSDPDLNLVVAPDEINSDAIGGFVRIESIVNGTLSTAIPLFAFEKAREKGDNLNGNGFIPGDLSVDAAYLGENQKNIRDLLRYNYISMPYSLDNSDARAVFTFLLDFNNIDEGNTGALQDRYYKQVFRNMEEKYPKESIACLQGEDLIEYVTTNYDDAANPNISPYIPPVCTLDSGYRIKFKNEVDGINISNALAFEANKKYTRTIEYQGSDGTRKVKVEELNWNDVDPADYLSGMYQIHDIQNSYDLEDGHQFDDGQTVDETSKAAYIPTFFDIKIIDGNPFLNWNYSIKN